MSTTKVILILAAGIGVGASFFVNAPVPAGSMPTIHVTARKFAYTPSEIVLKRGQPVILEFTTEDVLMGFNVPDLDARIDIIPGRVTRLRLVPQKTGRFVFLCDIFCGVGHENMSGTIVVRD
jgi:cytochrome c oxidase subunit 2